MIDWYCIDFSNIYSFRLKKKEHGSSARAWSVSQPEKRRWRGRQQGQGGRGGGGDQWKQQGRGWGGVDESACIQVFVKNNQTSNLNLSTWNCPNSWIRPDLEILFQAQVEAKDKHELYIKKSNEIVGEMGTIEIDKIDKLIKILYRVEYKSETLVSTMNMIHNS